jgi:hypothetical protein
MKLISPADFLAKDNEFVYMGRVVTALSVNVKTSLTIGDGRGHKMSVGPGIYSLGELKQKFFGQ